MNPAGSPTLSLRWVHISIIERFASVLYPIDLSELLRKLPHQKWVVSERILRGASEETGRPIAAKGNLELMINQDNKTLGVRGLDLDGPETVAEAFQALREFWVRELDPSPGLSTQYVEITAQAWAKSNKNPLRVFSSWWANSVKFGELGELLGCLVSNFGVRLAPSGVDPNTSDWYEIRIEPLIVSSEKRYLINIVWRHHDLEQVLHRLTELNKTVIELIREIEKE